MFVQFLKIFQENVDETTQQKQTRKGRLYVYQLSSASDQESPPLTCVHTADMPGILDIKWSSARLQEKAVFGLVNSVGELRLFDLEDYKVAEISKISLGEDVLGLSLDWSNKVSNRYEVAN